MNECLPHEFDTWQVFQLLHSTFKCNVITSKTYTNMLVQKNVYENTLIHYLVFF